MKKGVVLAAVVLSLSAAGMAWAEGPDVIEIRQAGMDLASGSLAGMIAVVGAKGDVKKLEDPAKAIQRWATLMPTLYPPGSDKGHHTRALPKIWSDPAAFQKAAAHLADASAKLAATAKTGNVEEVGADVKAVGQACLGCHREFRAK
jgi:cytochrome c556